MTRNDMTDTQEVTSSVVVKQGAQTERSDALPSDALTSDRSEADAPEPQQSKPSRRNFLIGGAALIACAVVGTGARPLISEADVLRPPGAVSEAEFMARCIRCNRCVSVCPTDILEPMGIEQGILQIRTPLLHYSGNYGTCTFCDKCYEVCPTEAIGPVDPYAPLEGRIGAAIIHTDTCLAYLNAGACGICVEACPYEALDFDDKQRPLVVEDLCNGCGECVKICPAASLTSYSGAGRAIEVVTNKRLDKIASSL